MSLTNPTAESVAKLNHPCRETCSGWKQGYDAGFERGIEAAADILAIHKTELENHNVVEASLASEALYHAYKAVLAISAEETGEK